MKAKRTIITVDSNRWLWTKNIYNCQTKELYRVYRRLKNNRLLIELMVGK